MNYQHSFARSAVLEFFVQTIAVLSVFALRVQAELGVAAGNAAGESSAAMSGDDGGAAGSLFVLPPAPTITRLWRIDKTSLKVIFANRTPADPFDKLIILRAKGFDPWEKVYEVTGSVPDNHWTDRDAPAANDYRYAALVIGERKANGLDYKQPVGSNPSEKRLSDVAATLHISAWNFTHPRPPAPAVELKIDQFVPESYSAAENGDQAPDSPYDYTGPLPPYEAEQTLTDKPGYLPRGVDLHGSGTLQSSNPFYYVTMGVYASPASSLAGGTLSNQGNGSLFTINDSVMKVYDATASGDETKGYDSRSNPVWQMLPEDGQAVLTINTDLTQNPNKDEPLQLQPESLPAGTGSLTVSANGAGPGEKQVSLPDFPTKVKIDVRPKRNPTVVVYPVYRLKVDAQHPNGVRIDKGAIPLPKKADLEAELNAIYRDQSNVFFTVVIAPQELEFTPLNDKDGNGKCAMNDDNENVKLVDKAQNNGFDYSLFLFSKGGWETTVVVGAGTPLERVVHTPGQGGRAYKVDSKWAVSDNPDANLLAHELGHCMGLDHAFSKSNSAPETVTSPMLATLA